MAFKPIDEVLEPYIELPIRGKRYRVDAVDALTGLWCQRIFDTAIAVNAGDDVDEDAVAGLQLDDDEEQDFNRRLLGPAYDEMLADRVSWEAIKMSARTVFTWTISDRETAESFWSRGGRPEAPRREPQDRRPAAKKIAAKKTAAKKTPSGR